MITEGRSLSSATPHDWGASVGVPDLSSDRTIWRSALLRHWTGTSPHMDQPLLDHHYIVQHLGGAKAVERRFDGSSVSSIAENSSITIVPAGTQFKWHTRGPIEFAHLYVSPDLLAKTARRFERAGQVSLMDKVGCRDPLLETLFSSMLAELRSPGQPETLFMDSLLETFLLRLVQSHSSVRAQVSKARETLAPYQLRRVMQFVESRLDRPLTLSDLADAAGGSIFHFVRAFKNTVGQTPYQYVLRRRTERAKVMLRQGDVSIASTALACGFENAATFVHAFKRFAGITPHRFRRR